MVSKVSKIKEADGRDMIETSNSGDDDDDDDALQTELGPQPLTVMKAR